MARPSPDPADFDPAVAWFRQRVPMLQEEWEELEEAAREKAFTVAGVAKLDLVTQVWRAIDRALSEGTSLEDFKQDVGAKLASAWGGPQPWRVDTIFRTNVQAAYSAGRWQEQHRPEVISARPFLRYVTTLDDRTTDVCRKLAGTILPADDPFWRSHNPPLHFGCRSTHMSLTREQAQGYGGAAERAPDVEAAEGFGAAPVQAQPRFEPDLSEYPAPLVQLYRK